MLKLYNFVTQAEVEVDVDTLTDDEVVVLIPQHAVAQSLYTLFRVQGVSTVEALTEVLKMQLMSGGPRTFIHVNEGGRK